MQAASYLQSGQNLWKMQANKLSFSKHVDF